MGIEPVPAVPAHGLRAHVAGHAPPALLRATQLPLSTGQELLTAAALAPTVPRASRTLAAGLDPTAAVEALTRAAIDALAAGESKSSTQARRSAQTSYEQFASAHGLPPYPLTFSNAVLFVTDYVVARGNNPKSLTGLLCHVRQAAAVQGVSGGLTDADRPALNRVIEGLERSYAGQNARGQAAPLRLTDLDKILTALGPTPTPAQRHEVLALLVLTQGVLRPGELAKLRGGNVHYALVPGAAPSDSPPLADIDYVELTLVNPKTEQKGTQTVFIVPRPDRFNAVPQLRELLLTKGADDPLFTRTIRGVVSSKPLTNTIVSSIVRKWVLDAGIAPDAAAARAFRGHSGRRGYTLDLDDAGETTAATRQGRWATEQGQAAYMGGARRIRVAGLARAQPVPTQTTFAAAKRPRVAVAQAASAKRSRR